METQLVGALDTCTSEQLSPSPGKIEKQVALGRIHWCVNPCSVFLIRIFPK